ncbi:hypothetical protein SAMN05216199_2350 [Pedococcus cremeus]|uniref:Uncharacterized protein n=1 Tax=Pedococcus cremeus TaxID=587636 RepID=A0A1H9VI02_9MICO|nr:hypothetical protein SAMN05216199_2350 [Pedococcus cremeus]
MVCLVEGVPDGYRATSTADALRLVFAAQVAEAAPAG